MVYEFIGQVIDVREQAINTKNGQKTKYEVVIEHDTTNAQYPRRVQVVVWDANVWNTIAFAKGNGDPIKAVASVDAREYNGRWYNEISCFKVKVVKPSAPQIGQPMGNYQPMQQQTGFQAPATPVQPSPSQPANPTVFDNPGGQDGGDANTDLPF